MPWLAVVSPTTLLWLLLLMSSALPASAKDAITWMEVSMPPFLIQEGPEKEQGYGNVVSAILRENLPEYDHFTMVTNVPRHFHKFKEGEKVCGVGLYRTPEREAFMHFSLPVLLTLPSALIIRKDKLADLGATSIIKLEDVLRNPNWVIGLSKDRSYGTRIDALLRQHRDRPNLIVYGGQELSANYFKMLMLDRLDGLIGLPAEAMYQAEKMGLRDQVAILVIEENQQGYGDWLCAVGCSKNEWGRVVIEKINQILREQRPTDRYRRAYERWLDAGSLAHYRAIYQEVFLAPPPPTD